MATRDHNPEPGFVEAGELALAAFVIAFIGFFFTLGFLKAYEILHGADLLCGGAL